MGVPSLEIFAMIMCRTYLPRTATRYTETEMTVIEMWSPFDQFASHSYQNRVDWITYHLEYHGITPGVDRESHQ